MLDGAKMIDRAAQSQQQLVDDLLDVSRMTSGKLRLALRETRLVNAIQGAIEALEPVAVARGVRLDADLSEDVGVVIADPDRIQQVVWNLLSNALKFTPSGGRASVTARRTGTSVEIQIVDTGIGIDKPFLPHVFDRFRQAEPVTTRQHGGLGLGLAIARQLVELHGGSISAASEGEGKGTTFTVRLPLTAQQSDMVPPESSSAREARSAVLQGLDILLVEDDEPTRYATQRLIEAAGAHVRAVNSAASAREAFSAHRPDLIVADIGLPGENGYELLERIRSQEQKEQEKHVPALALTAFARTEDRQRALEAGFNDHLPKPTDPDRLIAVIRGLRR
jgi:CheY-like chemotaxis protein/two-component sensor histidine kinase